MLKETRNQVLLVKLKLKFPTSPSVSEGVLLLSKDVQVRGKGDTDSGRSVYILGETTCQLFTFDPLFNHNNLLCFTACAVFLC